MTPHVETMLVPGRRLGRKPRDPNRPVLKLRNYLTGVIPPHPQSVDYFSRIPAWNLGANDRFSTCGPTSLANHLLLVSTWLARSPIQVTDNDIFDLYRRSGNPNFDPATGADDNGVDMTVMLSAAVQGGLGGVHPVAFALVDDSDPEEIRAAGAIFGCVLWGADLTVAQQRQTVWDYVPGSPEWGGHAIAAAGRYTDSPNPASDRTGLLTWAEALDATDQFITRQVTERYVVIWPWHLGTREFVTGINQTALAADYESFTGRQFPMTPPLPPPTPVPNPAPAPAPTPSPSPATDPDAILIKNVWPWPDGFHIGRNRVVADALKTWRTQVGK
ncbi:MAG: hypothetical protein ACREQ5_00795 [Candidatus Dormibacteria bacterium]